MYVVLVFRIAALVFRIVKSVGIVPVKQIEVIAPLTVFRCNTAEVVASGGIIEQRVGIVVGGTVVLIVAILEGIAELQEGGAGNGLAIGGTYAVVPRGGRRQVVAVGLILGKIIYSIEPGGRLEELGLVARQRLVFVVAIVTRKLDGNITPRVAQAAVNLECTAHAFVLAISERTAAVGIDKDGVEIASVVLHDFLQYGSIYLRINNVIGVATEGSREIVTRIVVSLIAPVGTEADVPQGIGRPLDTSLRAPAVRAREILVDGVLERAGGTAIEVLAGTTRPYVTVAMVPVDVGLRNNQLGFLIVEVKHA